MLLPIGTIVERYVLEGVIGEGGMATVYLAKHRDLGSFHAIKLLHRTTSNTRARLIREGRLQSTLRHPNIVAVTDLVHVGNNPGLVMEYVAGPTLHQFVQRYRLAFHQADALARAIMRGISAAHSHGMVHRDLKPANILLAMEDGRLVPKITDFGLAKALVEEGDQPQQTRTGTAMGTPGYMAPEQISDASKVDERADVFSLGAIFYEMITHQRAFGSGKVMVVWNRINSGEYVPPREHVPHIPARIARAIESALVVDRDERTASIAALLDDWITDPVGAPTPTLPPDDPDLWGGGAFETAHRLKEDLLEALDAQQRDQSNSDQTFSFQMQQAEENRAHTPRGGTQIMENPGSNPAHTFPSHDSMSPPSYESSRLTRILFVGLGLLTIAVGLLAYAVLSSNEETVAIPTEEASAIPVEADTAVIETEIAVCGDGEITAPEECDDGNSFGGDLCSAECTANVAKVIGTGFWTGYRESDLEAGMHLVVPSRRSDEYVRDWALYATPSTPVHLRSFWMMRTEVSWGAFYEFLDDSGVGRLHHHSALGQLDPVDPIIRAYQNLILDTQATYRQNERDSEPTHPAEASRNEAIAFCAWLGGSLPTEEQWELAARGPRQDRVFPWGNRAFEQSPEDCDLVNATFRRGGGRPDFSCGLEPVAVGSLTAGCTPEGICELSGNVDEFVIPGAVEWTEYTTEEGSPIYNEEGRPMLWARPAGTVLGSGSDAEYLNPCPNRQHEDPYGLVSGQVQDCFRPTSRSDADSEEFEQQYSADQAYSVVRGGNHVDSLPIFYQSRARYPLYPPNQGRGFRCVFSADPFEGTATE